MRPPNVTARGSVRVLVGLVLVLVSIGLRGCRAYTALSDETLQNLPGAGSDFDIDDGALLAPILRPRVPGTAGSAAVLAHFVAFFESTLPQWRLELQNSSSTTPATGSRQVPFVNLVATRDPPWAEPGEVGRLALVAHYDSKLTPTGFIGATDSAAPCAVILHAVRSIDAALTRRWAAMQADGAGADLAGDDRGVQVILLDGEEAFLSWTDSDSLYGARSLAEAWDQTFYPSLSTYRTPLNSIALFVLLDLLGAPDPSVPSYFLTTHWAYQHLAKLESRLRALLAFKSSPNHPSKTSPGLNPHKEPIFLPDTHKFDNHQGRTGTHYGSIVQDDHVPFLARGVEVLHLIPHPFPDVWHDMADDGEHLDLDTVEDWATLMTAFVAEWMDLEGSFVIGDTTASSPTDGDEHERGRVAGAPSGPEGNGDHDGVGDDGGDGVQGNPGNEASRTRRHVRREELAGRVTQTVVISKTEL